MTKLRRRRFTDERLLYLYRIFLCMYRKYPRAIQNTHYTEIQTAVGGVVVRSCSRADRRLPGIPRRIRGGTDLSAVRERVVTFHRPLRGVGALPLTEVSDSVDN